MMLHAPSLAALPGIRHAFFTREGGVSDGLYASLNAGFGSGDDPARVAENRARMAAAVGVVPENLLSAIQIHSADVIVAEAPWTPAERPKLDAIVTRRPGLAVCASTADCGPVLFADPEARVVGAAHAGWRGALAGVTDSTIAAMERLGAARERIVAAIGPMIRQPNYEVGPEVEAQFVAQDPDHARFFAPSSRDGHALFDLAGYVAARLAAAGLGRVEDVGVCTYAEETRFYSFRRATHRGEPDYGRHVNAIALMP
ncbi:peptidoglycan editing factor PgeF [Rhodoplanes serenus]|uniref:peptidoglycan editing factor PgeF n=1 Tax=Rhodoplanes serenus TaxID=200615 RepID=UPI000DAC1220|nr:peptidoglycan editing factor PgeF [Rhodoplanes serenus]RAI32949.1 polyphenol oxidase [Rhodoplanes serenus]